MKLKLTEEEANKQMTQAYKIMGPFVNKIFLHDISKLTEADAEMIWKLRGLLWEVAHHVSNKSGRLSTQHKTGQETDSRSRQNAVTA